VKTRTWTETNEITTKRSWNHVLELHQVQQERRDQGVTVKAKRLPSSTARTGRGSRA